jgi:uncharacterized membrane protein YdjX (TVP38/TMEM64 family)
MSAQNNSATRKNFTHHLKRWGPLIALLLVIALFSLSGLYRYFSFEALVENYGALKAFVAQNIVLAVALYILIYIAAVAFSFPAAWILTVASGIFFGWWIAGIATILGATLGASVLYWVASTSFGAQLRESAGPLVSKVRDGINENAVSYLLFLRFVPLFPFMLVNIVPAVLGVPFVIYFWTTFFGIAPGTFAYAYAGAGIASVVEAQAEAYTSCRESGASNCGISFAPSDLVTTELLIAFTFLGLVSLLPIVIKQIMAKRAANKKASSNG